MDNVYLYVLELENDYYYVGIAYDVKRRILQHIKTKKKGSKFTKKYKPKAIYKIWVIKNESWKECEYYETLVALYLHSQGKKVAGGKYISRDEGVRTTQMNNSIRRNCFNHHKEEVKVNFDLLSMKLEKVEIAAYNEVLFTNKTVAISEVLKKIDKTISELSSLRDMLENTI